jgi:hypothetical protein
LVLPTGKAGDVPNACHHQAARIFRNESLIYVGGSGEWHG